jgi:hypothetical protein
MVKGDCDFAIPFFIDAKLLIYAVLMACCYNKIATPV